LSLQTKKQLSIFDFRSDDEYFPLSKGDPGRNCITFEKMNANYEKEFKALSKASNRAMG
jgi:hypothetical protein